MKFSPQKTKDAYKKLPPEVQNLIMDNETIDLIANSLQEAGLNDEQAELADSEILYAMYCLQSLDDAINNIAKLSGKNPTELSDLKSSLQENIFSKYKIDIIDFIKSNKSRSSTPTQPSEKTKDQIKEELIKRREGGETRFNTTPNLPEVAPEIHPMVEPSFAQGSGRAKEEEVTHDAAPAPSIEKYRQEPLVITNQEEKEAFLKQFMAEKKFAETPKSPTEVSVPDYRYPNGVDPYRESAK